MNEHLVGRITRMRAMLAVPQASAEPHVRLVSRIMADQHVDGSWRSSTSAWTDVCTALAIEVLHFSDISVDTRWEIPDGTGGLPNAFAYLSSTLENGRWGSDWFDHAKVLRALARIAGQLPEHLAVKLRQGYRELEIAMDRNFAPDDQWPRASEWSGPATVAASCMAFAMLDDQRRAGECLTRLRAMQREDGSFSVETALEDLVPWHTANAVLALNVGGVPPSSPSILGAVTWLRNARRLDDGSWGQGSAERRADFTAYVGQAFFEAVGPAVPEVTETLSWLTEHQRSDGSIGALEGTLHAGVVFSRASADPVSVRLPLGVVVEAGSLLGEMVREQEESDEALAALEERAAEVASQDAKYFVKITSRQAVAIAFVVGVLLATFVAIVLSLM